MPLFVRAPLRSCHRVASADPWSHPLVEDGLQVRNPAASSALAPKTSVRAMMRLGRRVVALSGNAVAPGEDTAGRLGARNHRRRPPGDSQ